MGTFCKPIASLLLVGFLAITSTVSEKKKFKNEDWEYCSNEGDKYLKEMIDLDRKVDKLDGKLEQVLLSSEWRHQNLDGYSEGVIPLEQLWYKLQTCGKVLKKKTGYDIKGVEYDYTEDDNSTASQLVNQCRQVSPKLKCNESSQYRTADGSCNNLKNPTLGMAGTCQTRILNASYNDGMDDPRVSACGGGALPNPRNISVLVHAERGMPDNNATVMVMQWGQFSDHDLTLTPAAQTSTGQRINCCPPNGTADHPECMAIPIPEDDEFFGPMNKTCMNFVRSAACVSGCKLGPRQPSNIITHFVDASQVYGSNDNQTKGLRSFKDGLLIIDEDLKVSGEFLPRDNRSGQCANSTKEQRCFVAGDTRVNVQPGLTICHLIWLRQHNRVARKIKEICDEKGKVCSDEWIFQEARRIIIAQMQLVHFDEYLPVVLGPSLTTKFNLASNNCGKVKGKSNTCSADCLRTDYYPSTDPSTLTEFSTAGFRFGHSMIPEFLLFGDKDQQPSKKDSGSRKLSGIELQHSFFNTDTLLNGTWEAIVPGMCSRPTLDFDPSVAEVVRNHLYKRSGTLSGLDLVALNIQRGRDHGLQPYVKYYEYCTGAKISNFEDLNQTGILREECKTSLQLAYQCVQDIDLFSGGLCELPVEGGVVGPTFACIIARQMHDLKYGDRFFYTHGPGNGTKPFTDEQLCELQKTSFAEIICKTTGMEEIPTNVFISGSDIKKCKKFSEPNISVFV